MRLPRGSLLHRASIPGRSRRAVRSLVLVVIVLALTVSTAAAAPAERTGSRPRIGLVLGGGGARGGAHIGVLKVLEEMDIPIDYIAGTSIGSIVGGLYASGMSPDELDETMQNIDWDKVISDIPDRRKELFRRKEEGLLDLFDIEFGLSSKGLKLPAGLVAGQKLNFLLRQLTFSSMDIEDFDRLPIPFRAVATDLSTGEMVVLGQGNLADAMRASMAIPGVFTPKEIDGRTLIDGGVVRNLPVEIVRAMGADIVIAVDVGKHTQPLTDHASMLDIASQTMTLLTAANSVASAKKLTPEDILITPDLAQVEIMDFHKMHLAEEEGEKAANELRDRLQGLSSLEPGYRERLSRRRQERDLPRRIVVRRIEVEGTRRVPSRMVERRLRIEEGETLDLETLQEDLLRIYRIGEFEQVDFRLSREEDGYVLTVVVDEKDWGPDYLRLGMRLEGNFQGSSGFLVNVLHRHGFVNRLGAEWRNVITLGDVLSLNSEFYQPLDYGGHFFVAPVVLIKGRQGSAYLSPNQEVLFDGYRYWGSADVGLNLGNSLQLRGGLRFGYVDGDFNMGAQVETIREHQGEYHLRFSYDSLDATAFPTAGGFLDLELSSSREYLGASRDYTRLRLFGIKPWPVASFTLIGMIEAGTSFQDPLPVYDRFELGGLLHLSGFQWGQVSGEEMARLGLVATHRILNMNELLGRGIYGGLSLEAGNALPAGWEWSFDDFIPAMSIFGGADTVLGSIYIGWGWAEQGHSSLYFMMGHAFPAGRLR